MGSYKVDDFLAYVIKPHILKLEPYVSARMTFDGSGSNQDCIYIKLDANENPFPNHGYGVVCNQYPSKQDGALIQRLADLCGVSADMVLATRGMDEGLDIITRCTVNNPKDAVIINTPTFGFYQVATNMQNGTVVKVPLVQKNIDRNIYSYEFAANDIITAFDGAIDNGLEPKLIFLCNPNNPTGQVIEIKDIKKICEHVRDKAFVVVDEAYIDFCLEYSALGLLKEFENLVVTKTLSKAYSLAGARLGIIIANPKVRDVFLKVLQPYPISIPSIKAVLSELSPVGVAYSKNNIEILLSERERVFDVLKDLPDVVKIYRSYANFILLELRDSKVFLQKLKSFGIIARDRSNDGVNLVRLSIGSKPQNDLVLQALGVMQIGIFERAATYHRTTKETDISVMVNIDGKGNSFLSTGIGFFDHMLDSFSKHSGIDLQVIAKGDLHIDSHHTIEDVAICIASAIKQAIVDGGRNGIDICRYGSVNIPMDEARVDVVADFCNRAVFKFEADIPKVNFNGYDSEMTYHFFYTLTQNLGINLHIKAEGGNVHHIVEVIFKGVAHVFKQALKRSEAHVLSAKGVTY